MQGAIRTALLSAWDKSGLVEFARGLASHGVEILSSGGTAKTLREAGIAIVEVADYTGFPEIMDGRVKTLHPKIHAGILAVRTNPEHMAAAERHGVRMIDLVAVNLYPFERRRDVEMIDVGGPAMLRAAAKNHEFVVPVPTPDDYALVLAEMKRTGGEVRAELRRRLAARTFAILSRYDAAIASWLADSEEFPDVLVIAARKRGELRYGENPHQRAAVYEFDEDAVASLVRARFHGGKDLSYNNYLDVDAAWRAVLSIETPAAVIVKHTNPCGAATRASLAEAFREALAGDPQSAFGGILALNRVVDAATAEAIAGEAVFLECIVAPGYEPPALAILRGRPKWGRTVRILETPAAPLPAREIRSVGGGILVQTCDDMLFERWEVVAGEVDDALREDLLFAWRIVAHAKSNAIAIARQRALVGIGAGHVSRVDAAETAVRKAGERARGAAAASDAFFPFPDGVEALARAGVRAIVQPGGSVRDAEVIEAARAHGVAMVLTGTRHFRH